MVCMRIAYVRDMIPRNVRPVAVRGIRTEFAKLKLEEVRKRVNAQNLIYAYIIASIVCAENE